MTYVLHYAPDNASLIVRMALDHRGLPYRTQLVDRASQEQSSAAYRALNPNGLIPTLETPQGPLFETGAILLWLADTHGGLGPEPADPARGDFLKWLFFAANTLHPCLRMLFYPEKYIGTGHQDALRRGLQAQLKQGFATLDTYASQSETWLSGRKPGVLDFYTVALLRWPALYPSDADRSWFTLADYPALQDLCTRIETLPCTAGLQKAEGLGDTPFTAPRRPTPPEGSAT
ncbi:glutathione S-transferase family protein [Sulfitobacter mediterraneus]|uniref:glutathione S-transferase family protein n=1 Tax=Sulfitobacter mediterraneus TaxID=83219 RepID=UPI0019337322|nr:glutathione S-transferase family protein [Sulfitobacter mediterraneus]MBM1632565.1 glutathione S-transferase family protein [Sulfitobacter mediterraneus]MBM1640382.1 glutathione S-transferase family protein [Sulfitobacter mediterraneus]MBM1644430.1 glutathione S-transferase family protein [Sulfitobacter mediterraneus]MBM1648477.1 glutathione S-transferase family protein [Sulfitobacter mediterraneus]MBM1652522.1 glutathione S-transferase family protein [Sulfitobacter mediterraneus]